MTELKQLCAGYGNQLILHDVKATFERGKLISVIGPNGSGKSTLLKTLNSLEPVSGCRILDGKKFEEYTALERARKSAFVFQSSRIPQCSVFQLVLHGRFPWLQVPRRYGTEDREKTRASLALFGLEQKAGVRMETLSGGQQQKVWLAMALNQDPEYLYLDEPLTYLDYSSQLELLRILRQLKNQNRAVVLVIHDIAMALEISDDILVMDQGRVRYQGPVCETLLQDIIPGVFGLRPVQVEAEGQKKFILLPAASQESAH